MPERIPSRMFAQEDFRVMLKQMQTPRGFQASSRRFKDAIFGRDTLWIGRFCIDLPEVAHAALRTTAAMQGTQVVPEREEEPGKIAHEYRTLGRGERRLYEGLADLFGEVRPGVLLMYPTLDATPLWVILLGEYCQRYGRSILEEKIERIAGSAATIRGVLGAALQWICSKITASGVFEAERSNKKALSHPYHVLRDGCTAYRHEDGTLLNPDKVVSYVEVQGYAYDALRYGAELLGDPALKRLADTLQRELQHHFWLPSIKNFAMAIDTDPASGARRPTQLVSLAPVELLGTEIFDSLEAALRTTYTEGILHSLFTKEFRTEVGLRSFPVRFDALWPGYGYDGPRAIWPILNHLTARSLRRQGLHALAYDLAARMVNAVRTAGAPREVFFADLHGRVIYDPIGSKSGGEEVVMHAPGEYYQTWTIAACWEALHTILIERPEPSVFEAEVLDGEYARLWTLLECKEAFRNRYRVTPKFTSRAQAMVL